MLIIFNEIDLASSQNFFMHAIKAGSIKIEFTS
jgi:hypothetical protein